MLNQKLLEIRNKIKSKKPLFTRHDAHKKKRIGTKWRKPKGRQNKMRLNKKGYAKSRSTGYGSPNKVKGLSRNGLEQVLVTTPSQLNSLDPKTQGVIVSRTIGGRKLLEIIHHCEKANITILNFNPETAKKNLERKLALKKSKSKEIAKRKSAKKAENKKLNAKKESEDKKDKNQDLSLEEKKLQEKKEKDKLLTKKE